MRLQAKPLELPLGNPVLAAAMCAAIALPAGSGEELRAVAAALRRTAEALRSVLQQLRALAQPGSLWCGEASQAFSAKLAEPSEAHLDEVPVRYEGYAAALTSYAVQVDEARLELGAAQAAAADAVRAHDVIIARPGAPPSAVRDAEQACLFAASRYRHRYDQWVVDVNRCVDQLAVVDDADQLHNPHGWHAAIDVAAQVCGDVSTITAVLGVVALAVCPPAAPILFAASMVTSGGALAADTDRKVQYGEHVTITDLAFDSVGALPLAGAARGVRSAVRAATHAPQRRAERRLRCGPTVARSVAPTGTTCGENRWRRRRRPRSRAACSDRRPGRWRSAFVTISTRSVRSARHAFRTRSSIARKGTSTRPRVARCGLCGRRSRTWPAERLRRRVRRSHCSRTHRRS